MGHLSLKMNAVQNVEISIQKMVFGYATTVTDRFVMTVVLQWTALLDQVFL